MGFIPLGLLLMSSLFIITHRIHEVLDNKSISRAVALDISKALDKVWHKEEAATQTPQL